MVVVKAFRVAQRQKKQIGNAAKVEKMYEQHASYPKEDHGPRGTSESDQKRNENDHHIYAVAPFKNVDYNESIVLQHHLRLMGMILHVRIITDRIEYYG